MNELTVIMRPGEDVLTDPAWDALAMAGGSVFHTSRFLLAWWEHTTKRAPGSNFFAVEVMDGATVVGICALEMRDGSLAFAGGQDVVDYMGPVSAPGVEGQVAEAVAQFVVEGLHWRSARFAGLVAGDVMVRELIEAFRSHASHADLETYERVPRIDSAPGGYLKSLKSKRRAELLRKRARLTEVVGEVSVVSSTEDNWSEALETLLARKRDADEAMDGFVTEYGDFVRDLLTRLAPVGAAQVMELRAGERCLASAIVLTHRKTKLLYNMSYDLQLARMAQTGLSPGVVLVSHLVEEALDSGWRFDFLKGAQDYKLRLGGNPVDMVTITVEV